MEDIQQFLESRGHTKEALLIGSAVDKVAGLKLKNMTQTTINDYFQNISHNST